MKSEKPLEKLLMIDDQEENLECFKKCIEQMKEEGYLQNYEIEYLNNFDQGLEKIKEYTNVITDLFEGSDNPKGLKIALECYDQGIKCGILTEGNRHSGVLGTVRYFLDREQFSERFLRMDGWNETVNHLLKMGITPDEIKKRNLIFLSDLLIEWNDIPDKKNVRKVTKALKEHLNIPYLTQEGVYEKIKKKLPENELLFYNTYDIEGLSNYSAIKVKVLEKKEAEDKWVTDKLYLVKEENCEVYLKELKEGKDECDFPEFKIEGKNLVVKTFDGTSVKTKLE